ncbi:hypothetical protein PHYSODRAFT_293128 [Phytophthora sojae]|uniref:Uncharacterized protein n=1 Tax=Phytophthora sojae (strain P6497) TaxID=1094619 RepID=G4YGR2_PHYSP|nr:hypothetical protein PHYSODRAFT_293128 [Phytophthora sojae]EGZ27021.1 hypothetical protein PHYSODRAFT_293128 [Phytophthora sojae]|eukprot:XP_009514296.1 hypothetical protein PHYSODRAFT_293128 [Phytophthora sojae]
MSALRVQHGERFAMELLTSRIMTLEEFLAEEDQVARTGEENYSRKPIPVLLKAGETVDEYELAFERRLKRRNVDLGLVRHGPMVERRFRMDFAESRAWELRRIQLAQSFRTVAVSPSSDRQHCFHHEGPKHWAYHGIRSRRELLQTNEVPANEFIVDAENRGPNGSMFAGAKLKPITVVRRPREPFLSLEGTFERWLASKDVTLSQLQQDLEEERRHPHGFVHSRTLEYIQRTHEHSESSSSRLSSSDCRMSRGQSSYDEDRWDHKRPASLGPGRFEGRLNEKRPRLDLEVSSPQNVVSDISTTLKGHTFDLEQKVMSCLAQQNSDVVCRLEELVQEVKGLQIGVKNASHGASDVTDYTEVPASAAKCDQHDAAAEERELPVVSSANADILRVAEEIIAKSNAVTTDPILEKLTDKYKHFVDSIEVNEIALHGQVKEGKVAGIQGTISAINKEKQRRDEALADLVACMWRGRKRISCANLLKCKTQAKRTRI